MGTFMPSEIARLVLGYLEEQNCMSAYGEFLKVSPYLDECRGRNFTTVLMGYSLTDILEDYSSTQAHLLSCKPDELRKELRRYRTLLDKVKILTEHVHLRKLLNNCTITSSGLSKNSTQTSIDSPIKKHVQKTSNGKMCSDCNLLAANCVCKQHLPPILPNLFATPFKLDPTQAVELSSLPIESLVETTRLCDLPGTDNVEKKTIDKTAKDSIPVANIQLQVEEDLHLTNLTEKDMDISDCSGKNKRKLSQDISLNLSVKTNELLSCSEKRFWEVNDNTAAESRINKEKGLVHSPANESEPIEDVDNKLETSKEDCVKKKENRADSSFDEFANGVAGGTLPRKSSTAGDTTSTPELDANINQKKSKFINVREPDLALVNELHPTNSVNASSGSNVQVDANVNNDTTNPTHCEIYGNPFIASENPSHFVKPSSKVDVNSKIYSVNVSQTSNTNSLYVLRQEPESSFQFHEGPESSSQFLQYMSSVSGQHPKPSTSWQTCIDEYKTNLISSQDRSKRSDRNVIILSNDIVDTNILKNERKLVINKRPDNTNKAAIDSTSTSQIMGSSLMYSTAPICATQSASNTQYTNVSYAQTVPITVPSSIKNMTNVKQDAIVAQEIEVASRNIVSGKLPDVFISNGIMQIAPMTRNCDRNKIFSEADIMSMPTVIMLNPAEDPATSAAADPVADNLINVPVLSLPETSEITILEDDVITEKTVDSLADQKTEKKGWLPMTLMYNIQNMPNNVENDKIGITSQASSKSQNDMESAMTPQNTIHNKKSSSTPRRQHPHVRVLDFKSPPRHTNDRENVIISVDETNSNSKVEAEKFKFDQKDNKARTKLSTLYEECSVQNRVALDGCGIQTDASKNQFIPSVDEGKLQADLNAWKEMGSRKNKNSWDQDLRASIVKPADEVSGRIVKTKKAKNPKSKKKVKEKPVKKRVCKSTEDNCLDNSLEKNGKLLEEILEQDTEKSPQHKSKDTVIEDRQPAKRRLANKKKDTIKHKTNEKQTDCNKTNIVKEVILDNSIAAMKVDIIKPVLKVKTDQRSTKCNMTNELELDTEAPVPSTQITPEMSREGVFNPINAKCNLASLLETPLKMSMLDIPMQTPRFISPEQIFDPISDIKILTIPTPNFLNSHKTTLINKMASNSKNLSPYSRATDYSSGSSYYKPDENECTIDFTDIQSDAKDPLTLTEKDYEEQAKPGSEANAEKLFNCQNIIQEAKTIRPRRQCTLKVLYYNENTKFSPVSKPVVEVNRNKGNTEKGLKNVITKKQKSKIKSSLESSSTELVSSSTDSFLVEDGERVTFEKVLPKDFVTSNSAKQINSQISQVGIEQGMEHSPNKIEKALNNGAKKQTKLSIKKREIKMLISSRSKKNKSKSKMKDSKSLISRHIKSLPVPKFSCRQMSKNTCRDSLDHSETKPLPTKSRRKSSTPRKLEAISFKEESNQCEISGPPLVIKYIQNEHINAEEELPSLHFSSDEADTNIENVGEESEKRDDAFISEIREYIKSSDNTNISTLVDYPKKNSYDPETAKLIERDLLGSPNFKKEYSMPSPVLKTDQQSDLKQVVYAMKYPTPLNVQGTPSHNVNMKLSVSKISGKDNEDTQQVNHNPPLDKIENSKTVEMCNSSEFVINENKPPLCATETAMCESSPSDTKEDENAEAVVEWSISESNIDSKNFIKVRDLSIHDRTTLFRSHIDRDSFLMDICVYNTETEEEEDRKLNISPMIQLFAVNPERDYSRSKRDCKNQSLDKLNQIEILDHSKESKFSKETGKQSPEPHKELYDQSETALAVQSIMTMEKLYTPNKNRSTLSKRCLDLFGETASNISSPDKDDVQKDVEIAVCTIEGHKELDCGELEDGEYVSENESEMCLHDFDALKALDHRKRKLELEPDESEHGAKKPKDMHAPHILLKEFDIECILSKLHGPK